MDDMIVSACGSSNVSVFNESCRRLEIGRTEPERYAVPLYGYVMPLIVAVTVVTNTFVVVVLSKKHLRTPTNHILLTMAVAELFTGLSSSPWLIYYYTCRHYVDDYLPAFWCEHYHLFAVTFPSIFHTAAMLLTVYLAFQRYIYVCLPRLVSRYCTRRQTKVVIVLLCALAVVAELPLAYTSRTVSVVTSAEVTAAVYAAPRRVCVRLTRAWVRRLGVNRVYSTLYWLKAICLHALPCLVLSAVTAALVRTVRATDRKRSQHISKNHPKASVTLNAGGRTMVVRPSSVRTLHSTTRMLLVVISIFLFIEIPVAVLLIFYVLLVTGHLFEGHQAYLWLARINVVFVFRNVLIIITYPLNFAIYCGMSEQFRTTVRQMFGGGGSCGSEGPSPEQSDAVIGLRQTNGLSGAITSTVIANLHRSSQQRRSVRRNGANRATTHVPLKSTTALPPPDDRLNAALASKGRNQSATGSLLTVQSTVHRGHCLVNDDISTNGRLINETSCDGESLLMPATTYCTQICQENSSLLGSNDLDSSLQNDRHSSTTNDQPGAIEEGTSEDIACPLVSMSSVSEELSEVFL